MKNKEYALALSGGGTRGAYEIGAYRALKEMGINIVAIAGTSIGALNGAMFVSDNLDKAEEMYNNIKIDNVIDIGITDRMLSKGISYNSSDGTFKYSSSYTRLDIANMPIIKYEVKSIKKNSKNKFTIVFEKLIVKNPYDILNYYNDSNSKKEITDEIFSYLKGEAKISSIKKYVNKEHIKDMNGKVDDEIKINLIIKNDKLLVSSEK